MKIRSSLKFEKLGSLVTLFLVAVISASVQALPSVAPGVKLEAHMNPAKSLKYSSDLNSRVKRAVSLKNSADYRHWPGGIVKYKLSPFLSQSDRTNVHQAFDEYHRKTCIKFQPREPTDRNFVTIKHNDLVCGRADLCMEGGEQFVQFGKHCRQTDTVIHELGHTLCLYHEKQRADRDEYMDIRDILPVGVGVDQDISNLGNIYDYASQMHYQCGSIVDRYPKDSNVELCGSQVNKGLSVLDADHINELYNCQACHRHRWRPIDTLTREEKKNLHSFGHTDLHGFPIYPCRAYLMGEVSIGKYSERTEACHIPWGGKEHLIRSKAEVFTIPGGPQGADGSTYQLVTMGLFQDDKMWKKAIPAGHIINHEGHYSPGYIGYGNVTEVPLGIFEILSSIWGTLDDNTEDLIGKVWRRPRELVPLVLFPFGGREVASADFKVLICK